MQQSYSIPSTRHLLAMIRDEGRISVGIRSQGYCNKSWPSVVRINYKCHPSHLLFQYSCPPLSSVHQNVPVCATLGYIMGLIFQSCQHLSTRHILIASRPSLHQYVTNTTLPHRRAYTRHCGHAPNAPSWS